MDRPSPWDGWMEENRIHDMHVRVYRGADRGLSNALCVHHPNDA